MIRVLSGNVAPVVATFFLLPLLAPAQITTGTVMGRVADSTGAVVPSAQVTLISEARGTRSAAVITNETGDYVFPNVTPDTYTVEVTAPSFKITRRAGIVVTGGDRVGVPPLTLEVGGTTETVTVTAEAALVQTQSGERSFAIESKQVDELPIVHGNFTSLVAFTPGVAAVPNTSNYGGGTRLGGPSQNNIMMDGISAMDTGNNGQMLNMNIESIGEVKVLTQGYQAEYGRSSGLQITACTKSGTNQLHGSGYGLFTNSDWNKNSWVNQKNGDRAAGDEPADLRLHHWRPGRHTEGIQRAQQAVLLLRARVPAVDPSRSTAATPFGMRVPTAARAGRRLLPDPRQQRRPAHAADRLHDGGALPWPT